MTTADRPRLLFYCQHAVGLGHLARSLALADGLARQFDVLLLNGGRMPSGTRIPDGVQVLNLPALGHDEVFDLVSHEPGMTVDEIVAMRPGMLLAALRDHRPEVVLVELFPFGRKKFRFELLPFLDAIDGLGAARPLVACSLRDILVGSRRDQAGHDEKASRLANRYFDAVLMHADPAFARLSESFAPATALEVPVHYTGFVAPEAAAVDAVAVERERRVIVSAGGGSVGGPLVRAALAAQRRLRTEAGLATTIITGPFAPDEVFAGAAAVAAVTESLTVLRHVPDLCGEMRRSAVTVSQCGYNTAMDILRAGTPAVVVPYAEGREDEQRRRVERLERLGVLKGMDPGVLDGTTLADAVLERLSSPVAPVMLDLEGRHHTARILRDLVAARASSVGAAG